MRPAPLQVMHVDVNGGIVTWKKIMITRIKESINTQKHQYNKKKPSYALTRPKPLHVGQTVGVAFCGYPCPSGLIKRKLLA